MRRTTTLGEQKLEVEEDVGKQLWGKPQTNIQQDAVWKKKGPVVELINEQNTSKREQRILYQNTKCNTKCDRKCEAKYVTRIELLVILLITI